MRSIRAKSDAFLDEHRRLSPAGWTIAVGGAHIDPFVKGEALAEFLRILGRGGDVAAAGAGAGAKSYARECVAKWNKRRGDDWQVHFWEGHADDVIENAVRMMARIAIADKSQPNMNQQGSTLMKALFSRPSLLAAIESSGIATAGRTPMTVLRSVCLRVGGHADNPNGPDDPSVPATLSATNQELWLRLVVSDVTVERPGTILLPRDRAAEVLRSCDDDQVSIEIDPAWSGSHVLIRGARSKTRLVTEDPNLFPATPAVDFGTCYSVAAGDLRRAIRLTAFAASKGDSQSQELTGCLFEFVPDPDVPTPGGTLFIGGTESHHAAGCEIPYQPIGEPSSPGRPMVPSNALGWLERRLGDLSESDRVSLAFLRPRPDVVPASVAVAFPSGDLFQSRLLEKQGPKIREGLTKGGMRVVGVQTSKAGFSRIPLISTDFLRAVQQVQVTTAEESMAISLSIADGVMTFSAGASDVGDSTVELPVGSNGAVVQKTKINPRFLIGALRAVGSGMELVAEFGTPMDPVMLRMEGWNYAVVPMA